MSLQGENIVCFAGEDWWYHNPHSNLHIMKSFAKNNRVLFVNSIGVRMPSFKNDKFAWKRIRNKLRSLFKYFRRVEKNIYVFTPLAVPPFAKFEKSIMWFNKYLLSVQILLVVFIYKFHRPIIWVALPSAKDAALFLRKRIARCLVYYCTDNIPFLRGTKDEKIFQLAIDLQKNADITLFVNHDLLEEYKQYHPNTFFLNHGVDFDHFFSSSTIPFDLPTDLTGIPRPIIGYMGAVRSLDFNLVKFLASANKNLSFVFIGDILMDLTELQTLPNVYFLGKKSYELLPQYLHFFDVCCLYYENSTEWIKSCNPKKFLEYLATGRPIISVELSEFRYVQDKVYMAKTYEEFNGFLQTAIHENDPEKSRQRIAYAQKQTWDDVANQAAERILNFMK